MARLAVSALIGAVLWVFSALSPAAAQHPLFADDSELPVVLDAPLTTLLRTAARNTDPHPAVFTLTPPNSAAERFDIQLSARGVSRRTGDICNFPPLRLDFDVTRGTYMRGQNRVKLVTRCRVGSSYEQFIVLEYLAYRLYNEITPRSFRVRPLRLTYRDTEGRRREETQFNFVIEDVDDVARRNERMVALDLQMGEISSVNLDPAAAARYALFQYMIGNLDWDMALGRRGEECCHNSKVIAVNAETRTNLTPVPYDFDYSGLVNAPYALPPASINIRSVRTRVFRGYCRHNDELPAAVEHFRSRRAALLAVIDSEQRLSASARTDVRNYIESFFAVIDDPRRVQRDIVERCRG